jgi:hypothetical protein
MAQQKLPRWLSPKVVFTFIVTQLAGSYIVAAISVGAGVILAALLALGALAYDAPWLIAVALFLGATLLVSAVLTMLLRRFVPHRWVDPEIHGTSISAPPSTAKFPAYDPSQKVGTRNVTAVPVDMNNDTRYFRAAFVPLAALGLDGPWINERTFEDCTLMGPAVVGFSDGNQITDSAFDLGPYGELFWINDPVMPRAGMLAFKDCTFRRCVFYAIGIAGDSDDIERFKAGLSGAVAVPYDEAKKWRTTTE